MKKFLMMAVFGLAGLAAFAGTCVVTRISLVSTDGTHKTFAGQLDNTSGVNILQHNFLVAFLDGSNNLVETHVVPGCLRSVQNGSTDYFSQVSVASSSGVSTGLARIAFDSTFRVGTTSSQNISVTNILANRTTTSLNVTGKITNNASNTLISPNVCIVVRDSAGNVLITATTTTADINASGNKTFASGAITVPNDSSASKVDVWVDGLDASNNPTTPDGVAGTSVTAGANKLAWTTQPENNTGGIVFTSQPVITLQNAAGTTLTTATDNVTLSVVSGPGTLTCTTNPQAAVAGIATFGGCSLNTAGNYVLRASATGYTSADTTTIVISVGAAAKFGFTTQPSAAAVSAAPLAQQPVVQVQDAGGNAVAAVTPVTLSSNPGASGITCPTNPVTTNASGVAAFAGCNLTIAGTYTLLANGAYAQGVSTSVVITAGAAAKLTFTQQPSATGMAGTPFAVQPKVAVTDNAGNVVLTDNVTTVTLASAPGGTLAGCTAAVTVVQGVATFTGCSITPAGTYHLVPTSNPVYTLVNSNNIVLS